MADEQGMWERIAASFDATRARTWPEVEDFMALLPPRSRVLDLMAGNGRHACAAHHHGHHPLWLDWSRPAARIARGRGVERIVVADATRLPLTDRTFDAVLYVAGLHGIPGADARNASLREAHRVLRPGGRILVTVWRRNAPRFAPLGPPGQETDVQVPWRAHGHDERRHIHLYTREALERDVAAAGFHGIHTDAARLGAHGPDNWLLHARRPAHPL